MREDIVDLLEQQDRLLSPGAIGFALAALLSGFLATFSSCVNAGASYLVKDVYKVYVSPQAGERRLVHDGSVANRIVTADR